METIVPAETKLLAQRDFGIAKFWFYPNYLVGEFAEGMHVTKENALQPIRFAKQFYGDTPIIYISHRRNSYSMDTIGYKEVVDMFPNFIGFAIVSKNKYRRMIAHLEKMFIKRPIGVFLQLDEAYAWAEEELDKHQKHSSRP
ncbi:hypothetical protein Q4603_11975 [Zobellia galactanivorans]|uniref:STAS/SEC14 domain-containing protein n=1 Tax=Zobellia galactanivorans (strain DSM 12802 / CCUG 47099 / CIP 106680 / NCIMB 13871 / Dsij) TaxID=63186 RepID=G0LBD6_ZOBGA|nr:MULTISPECIES: hypothetical protein [Zobellia]MBU3026520.1 hypothetical protein [Zobellia galactanivorans]MDO6809338.1 hypothetical protein [Zobellia galactanivorans]OWW26973.1 hypothetical protein B4Q04_04665 [Zobellia sp. OII3]CAZ95982.1 Conserved hypothetical protein [Zobellia galactanivorans]